MNGTRIDPKDDLQPQDDPKRFSSTMFVTSGRSLRPDQFNQIATISASRRSSSGDLEASIDKMIIRKTETWSVRIEEEKKIMEVSDREGTAV